MSGYYAMKTRYFVIQLMKGVTLIGISICITAAIVTEMLQKYDAASRMAYIIGLSICGFILLAGLFLCVLAFHFDRVMLGRKKEDYALLQKELSGEDAVAIRDFVVTNHFVMIYTKQFSGFCKTVRMKDIIACFENPVYGTVEKINDYTISIYDKRFDLYQIVLSGDAVEDGHLGVEKIYARKPWIFRENPEDFEERKVTSAGRRSLMGDLEKMKRGEEIKTLPENVEEKPKQKRKLPALRRKKKADKARDEKKA